MCHLNFTQTQTPQKHTLQTLQVLIHGSSRIGNGAPWTVLKGVTLAGQDMPKISLQVLGFSLGEANSTRFKDSHLFVDKSLPSLDLFWLGAS